MTENTLAENSIIHLLVLLLMADLIKGTLGWFHVYKYRFLCLGDFQGSCYTWEPCFLVGEINVGLLLLTFPAHLPVLLSTVRKGYRIQADKERDSMKVLYYVEKELAQFDPARRMRGRCEHLLVFWDL